MKIYIHNAASITAQGFAGQLRLGKLQQELDRFRAAEPDYKPAIPPMALRRMSKITRMSLMCAHTLMAGQSAAPEGIIVATGLGNLADTEKFLEAVYSADSGLISPTAFTQSSHNTLSGQIALATQNHGYNMTHVQGMLSFEQALVDACMQLSLGMKSVLLGAADEHIPLLDELAEAGGFGGPFVRSLGEGASFFRMDRVQTSGVVLRDVAVARAASGGEKDITDFLERNDVSATACHVLTFGALGESFTGSVQDLSGYTGYYMTRPAFAMHVACSAVSEGTYRHVLVVNRTSGNDLGLILISHA